MGSVSQPVTIPKVLGKIGEKSLERFLVVIKNLGIGTK